MPDTKILLVDDVDLFLNLESTVLARSGYTTIKARGGAEALRTVRHQKPDLVVLDLSMPDLGGDDVCRLLKAYPETSPIPVILVTARHNEEDSARCRSAGADGCLSKPIPPGALLSLVDRLLGIRHRTAERHPANIDCTLRLGDSACGGRIRTLSPRGAFVEVPLTLVRGKTMEITFYLPGAQSPLRLRSVVRWSGRMLGETGPVGAGVEFRDLSPEAAKALEEWGQTAVA